MMPMEMQHFTQHEQTYCAHYPSDEMTSHKWPIIVQHMLPTVKVELCNYKLWQQFYGETNEMIITKSGRRMFPSIQINVSGLKRREHYYVLIVIVPASDHRFKYSGSNDNNTTKNGGWTFAGPAEAQPHLERRIYIHPDSPSTGEYWMRDTINFNKLKLTNNIVDHRTNVVLTSMHKYIPHISIIRCHNVGTLKELFSYPASVFAFKETEFIAVTAYQNEHITKLKINHNPFAKGFRETGQSRSKRKQLYTHDKHFVESDSNRSENTGSGERNDTSIDNLPQQVNTMEMNSDQDDCESLMSDVTEKTVEVRKSKQHESEMPQFHRPWLPQRMSEHHNDSVATSSEAVITSFNPAISSLLSTRIPPLFAAPFNWISNYFYNVPQFYVPQYSHCQYSSQYFPRYS